MDIFCIEALHMAKKHMKRCSVSLISRRMQIKPGWHITSQLLRWLFSKNHKMVSIGEDVEKKQPLCTVSDCELVQPIWKTIQSFLKSLKTALLVWFSSAISGYVGIQTETSISKRYLLKKVSSCLCSLQHYSQKTRYGSNLNVHQQMNG